MGWRPCASKRPPVCSHRGSSQHMPLQQLLGGRIHLLTQHLALLRIQHLRTGSNNFLCVQYRTCAQWVHSLLCRTQFNEADRRYARSCPVASAVDVQSDWMPLTGTCRLRTARATPKPNRLRWKEPGSCSWKKNNLKAPSYVQPRHPHPVAGRTSRARLATHSMLISPESRTAGL